MAEEEKKAEKVENVEAAKAPAKKTGKEKRPTALKRILQSRKRNLRNRDMNSRVKTAIKDLSTAVEKKEDKASISEKLNLIFSLSDKAVKMNLFKKNKADRIKSKAALKTLKV
jgi:small subunit ribosomal protein S20